MLSPDGISLLRRREIAYLLFKELQGQSLLDNPTTRRRYLDLTNSGIAVRSDITERSNVLDDVQLSDEDALFKGVVAHEIGMMASPDASEQIGSWSAAGDLTGATTCHAIGDAVMHEHLSKLNEHELIERVDIEHDGKPHTWVQTEMMTGEGPTLASDMLMGGYRRPEPAVAAEDHVFAGEATKPIFTTTFSDAAELREQADRVYQDIRGMEEPMLETRMDEARATTTFNPSSRELWPSMPVFNQAAADASRSLIRSVSLERLVEKTKAIAATVLGYEPNRADLLACIAEAQHLDRVRHGVPPVPASWS